MDAWKRNLLGLVVTVVGIALYRGYAFLFKSYGFVGEFYAYLSTTLTSIALVYIYGVAHYISEVKKPLDFVPDDQAVDETNILALHDTMLRLGFRPMEPLLRTTNDKTRIMGYIDDSNMVQGNIIQTENITGAHVVAGFTSTFRSESIELNTLQNPLPGYVPQPRNTLYQVIPKATLDVLLQNHEKALLYMQGLNYTIDDHWDYDVLAAARESHRIKKEHFLKSPIINATTAIFSTMMRTKIHCRPISKQRIVLSYLDKLSKDFASQS
jgi:hypothetical protein